MPDLRFGCTLCGRCCNNHSLPLTLDEAIAWLEDDGSVAIYCEAHTESLPGDLRAEFRRKRSFPVRCGSSLARVTPIFVAVISGACKNLGQDLKCRIYERRPLVCRIYPAEISPFIQLDTTAKACPPEAWLSGDQVINLQLQRLVEESSQTDRNDVLQKMLVCRELKMNIAAVADEGYATYYPEKQRLLDALRKVRMINVTTEPLLDSWNLYSPSEATAESLRGTGLSITSEKRQVEAYSFLHAASSPNS